MYWLSQTTSLSVQTFENAKLGAFLLGKSEFRRIGSWVSTCATRCRINSGKRSMHRKQVRRSLRPAVLLICLNNETSPRGWWVWESRGKRKSMHIQRFSRRVASLILHEIEWHENPCWRWIPLELFYLWKRMFGMLYHMSKRSLFNWVSE